MAGLAGFAREFTLDEPTLPQEKKSRFGAAEHLAVGKLSTSSNVGHLRLAKAACRVKKGDKLQPLSLCLNY